MSITDTNEIGKSLQETGAKRWFNRLFVPVIIVLVAIGGFAIGKLAKIREVRPSVVLETPISPSDSVSAPLKISGAGELATSSKRTTGNFVAARGGTAYYMTWCSGADRIAEKNKIWFETKEEAERLGYKLANGCK